MAVTGSVTPKPLHIKIEAVTDTQPRSATAVTPVHRLSAPAGSHTLVPTSDTKAVTYKDRGGYGYATKVCIG